MKITSLSVCLSVCLCVSVLAVSSKLPYDVTPEQAMSHEEVRTRLEASIKNMKTITDKFLSAIIVSVDKIPYVPRRHGHIFEFRGFPRFEPPCLSLSDTGCVSSLRC